MTVNLSKSDHQKAFWPYLTIVIVLCAVITIVAARLTAKAEPGIIPVFSALAGTILFVAVVLLLRDRLRIDSLYKGGTEFRGLVTCIHSGDGSAKHDLIFRYYEGSTEREIQIDTGKMFIFEGSREAAALVRENHACLTRIVL